MARSIRWIVGGLTVVVGVSSVGFVWAFRTKFPPVQDAIRRFNRDVTNQRQLRDSAGRPGAYASVVHHVGRRSGTPYRTPVVVVPDGDGFAVALPYGPGADWVRNVVAAGSATVEHEGQLVEVHRPELVDAAATNHLFPAKEQRTHRLFGVTDFLRLERLDDQAPASTTQVAGTTEACADAAPG